MPDPQRDVVAIDVEALRAARMKYRRVVIDAERGRENPHAAYKLGQFLDDALGPVWRAMDDRAPDFPDGTDRPRPRL
jgi:hypothetical protein